MYINTLNAKTKPEKPLHIGGQAVMEGVMMRAPNSMAITVRRPDGTMVTQYSAFVPVSEKHPWMGKRFLRGIVNMITMLYYGMNTLSASTKMLGVLDEEPTKFEKWLSKHFKIGIDKVVMAVAIVLAVALSVGLFIALPAALETLLKKFGMPAIGYTLLSGVLKIAILAIYLYFSGKVPEVGRTFMYHGAEHKSVFCFENKKELTPENAEHYSRLHPRCGTAFLLIVLSISILLFLVLNILVPISNFFLRFLFHIAMLPIVAGLSFEVLMSLADSDSPLANALRWPGLQMQRLTTREPDRSMLECAIVSVNVALHGLPEHAEKTPEGWALLHSFRESEPGYVPPEPDPSTDRNSSNNDSESGASSPDSPEAANSSETSDSASSDINEASSRNGRPA